MRARHVDIAESAGVSVATVDRVMNGRGGVRGQTRDLVLKAAARFGYRMDSDGDVATNSPKGDFRKLSMGISQVEFLLPAGDNTFISVLRDQIDELSANHPALSVRIREIEGFDPQALSAALDSLDERVRGLCVVAIDHPVVREALRRVARRGIRIVSLASDVHGVSTVGYVGIDNRAAGRLAGFIIGRFLRPEEPQEVAVFAGSFYYRGHEERESGFKSVLSESFPHLKVVSLSEVRDDRRQAYEATCATLDAHQNLQAIYSIGAGNQGIAQALKERGKDQDIVVVGHDISEPRKGLLLDGTFDAIIDQYPRVQAREALALLDAEVSGQQYTIRPPRLQIIFRENIPIS